MQQRWQDWVGLVLGVLLVLSPFALGYTAAFSAAFSAWVFGVATIVLFGIALIKPSHQWEEWVNLALAVLLLISPFAMHFTSLLDAAYTHWILGALIGLDAIWALYVLKGKTPSTV